MSTIVLKTANRNTTVSRIRVRQAVAAVYSGQVTLRAPAHSSTPAIRTGKKTAAKNAATGK